MTVNIYYIMKAEIASPYSNLAFSVSTRSGHGEHQVAGMPNTYVTQKEIVRDVNVYQLEVEGGWVAQTVLLPVLVALGDLAEHLGSGAC